MQSSEKEIHPLKNYPVLVTWVLNFYSMLILKIKYMIILYADN